MSLISDIRRGVHDDDLDELALAIMGRKKTLGVLNFSQFQVGDRVRFVPTIKPTYLRGVEATVVGKKVSKLIVRMDAPVGRFRGDLRVPGSLVERAEA
jgi:hypothetical protein